MKLLEIFFSPASADLGQLTDMLDYLKTDNKIIKQLNSKQKIGESGNKLTFLYDDEIVGFLSLGSNTVNFNGKKYLSIKMIYILPKFRKTFALGLFIIGVSQVIKHPIAVGVDQFGGVLSPDGAELVKSLAKKKYNAVKVLNLKTGEERDIIDSDFASDNSDITFVFYGDKLPLKIAEDELAQFNVNFWVFEDTLNNKLYEINI